MIAHTRIVVAMLALASWAAPSLAAQPASGPTLTPVQAARLLVQRKDWARARHILLFELYKVTSAAEEEYLLGQCEEALGRPKDAVAAYAMCVRTVAEPGSAAEPRLAMIGKDAKARLDRLDVEGARARQAYRDAAAGKVFRSPELVGDGWMTQVTASKLPLDMLQHPGAAVLDAGKKGWTFDETTATMVPPAPGKEKAHDSPTKLTGPQEFPRRHSSGAGWVEEAGGRKGVLFVVPNWKTRQPSQFRIRNVGKCDFLRVGVSPPVWSMPNCEVAATQDKCDFVLNVHVGHKKLFTQVVTGRRWTDLKVDLGEFRGRDVEVIVENAAGGQTPYNEGAYFDYIDFFNDAPTGAGPATAATGAER